MIRVLIAAVMAVLSWIALLPVFVLTGALTRFVWCVRALGRLTASRCVPWPELGAFDPNLGWRPRPDLDVHYLVPLDDVYRVTTDREGWPGTQSLDESAVVVIGDSFAFGYGVDTGSSFADLSPGLVIKGVGAPGYSMVQTVLLIEEFAKRLTGKLVVWFVCLENDLEDNLSPSMSTYRAPFVRPSRQSGEWQIGQEHIGPSPWHCTVWGSGRTRLLPHLCVPGPIADRAYAGADYLIGRASAACSRLGANLVLVTIPDPTQLTVEGRAKIAAMSGSPDSCDENLPDKRLAESCKRHGVPIVIGKDNLSAGDYKTFEGLHWNARGHRRMAEVIGKVYASFRSGAFDGLPSKPHPARALDGLARLGESTAGLQ
jgi:hypothetical protein